MGKENEFLEAARAGNVAAVEKYLYQRSKRSGPLASLRRTPTTNVQDSNGYSALHYAALNGHTEVVQVLLIGEANPDIQDPRGSGPLHLAAWAGHQEVVKLLLSNKVRPAEPNLQTADLDTPLHCAAQHGHTGALTSLLAHGADPQIINARGETPFDLAAQYGRLQAVQMLIRAYPDLLRPFRRPSLHIRTPLHLAARNGHVRVVELLLAAGMDVNVATEAGSALHEAALCGKDAVVRTLLASGANLGATDSHGRTPIDLLEEFPPHVTRRIVNVINAFRRPRSSSPRSPARTAPPKPPRRNLSVSPTKDVALRDYDPSRKLKRWRHSHFIENCIAAARCPLSPTNYLQPPTPEHAPPPASVAETTIIRHMRPFSATYSDVATSPESTYSVSSSDDDSDTSDGLFRGTTFLTRTSLHERSRTYITHQRFDVIDRGRLGEEPAPPEEKSPETPDTRSVDVRCLMEKKEWRALSKSLELFGGEYENGEPEVESELDVVLASVGLAHLADQITAAGFDSVPFLAQTLRRDDLADLNEEDFGNLLNALPKEDPFTYPKDQEFNLKEWLESIHLGGYIEVFERHLMTTWERVSRIWESELQTLLEIEKIGHRRRILQSLDHLNGLLGPPKTIQTALEMHNPLEVVGVVSLNATGAKWRHAPVKLTTSAITYRALYLGATPIDVTHDAATTRDSIVMLRRQEARSAICLTISCRGIERLPADTKNPRPDEVCLHSMRDIAFACQDADDFSHFALITNEGRHLCHVFSAQSMDLATEIILTIGQCFEIAYQMALCGNGEV
ncbi:ankyrin repeat and sterile alpha motif domain-containing protein 1B-like [Lutzomyia longipalpis]|uniref:ankyrin repeat and sterile alpha motif domain-containing protein 1B-like n=1 Tax=Lutzomyia longipalpis TaxID=7200 RepID=UPI00248417E2|nr:ankyrin repeat and sterile alpha motif domain-containing protein 1B-like [Lutzomyia longipalpis]